MSIPLTINGALFNYPVNFDTDWGIDATGWAQAVTAGMLQKAGGSFPLTAAVDFGTSFGIKVLSLTSETANPATTGYIRLAKTDTIDFRNNANSTDLPLAIDGSDNLTFNGVILATNGGGTVNLGTAGDLALYPSSSTTVGDIYVQNAHSIKVSIAAQAARTQNLTYILPNPGNAVSTDTIALLDVNQTFGGTVQFSSQPVFQNGFQSSGQGEFLGLTNQLQLGTATTITLSAAAPSVSRTYLIQDVGTDSTFVMADGTQVIGGSKTFTTLIQTFGIDMRTQSAIEFDDATATGSVNLSAPNTVPSTYSLFLPTAQGAANSFLRNDGSGNLSFATANAVSSSSGATADQTAITTQTITTTGGPVLVMASATLQITSVINGGAHDASMEIDVTRGGTSIPGARAIGQIAGVTDGSSEVFPLSIVAIDIPAAGTYTYRLTYNPVVGTGPSVIIYSLVLVEMP